MTQDPTESPEALQAETKTDVDVTRALMTLFPTPILNYKVPGADLINPPLRELVLDAADSEPSQDKSNVGGWSSARDFIHRPEACVHKLRECLQAVIIELTKLVLRPSNGERRIHFDLQGWAGLLRMGDYHGAHCHPGSFWSGVYYVTEGETVDGHPLSGKLELIDPRAGASVQDARETYLYGRYLVDPAPGQLLIFPSWLVHCVHPFFGDSERISISFNVDFGLE